MVQQMKIEMQQRVKHSWHISVIVLTGYVRYVSIELFHISAKDVQALLCHADRHREVMLKSPTHGKTEKYARTCGDLDALYDEVGYRG